MRTSDDLEEGLIYTRHQLRERYDINDATINNGIFRPKGHDSVWLFVTERKSSGRTPYADMLNGDTLECDGQMSGRTDRLILEHVNRGLELLVFYRKRRDEYPSAGFKYEGSFRYVSHVGAHPTHYTLERMDSVTLMAEQDIQATAIEETYHEGERKTVLVNKYERDPKLRAATIRIHGTTCQGCGFSFGSVYGPRGEGYIEVHHVRPLSTYPGEITVDPRTDMAVLCANCHRMVHRKANDPLDIVALRQLIDLNHAR